MFFSQVSRGLKILFPAVFPASARRLLISYLAVLLCLFPSAAQPQSKSPSTSFASLSKRAAEARDADRLDDAVALYTKALTLQPKWAEGWWSLATIEYDQDHYAKAALDFRKLLALQPENGTAHAMLGLCDFELGHEALALQHIQKGKNIGLSKEGGLWNVVLYHEGILLQRDGKFQAAQETLEDLCLRGTQTDAVANVLGMTLLRLSSKAPPAQGSRDADVVVRIGRAECLVGQKRYDEARPVFEAVVKENPDYHNIHYAYGLFLLELRDVAGSVEQFKQEIVNHPDDVVARLRIAATEYKQDSAAGIPYAEEVVKMDPLQPFGHYMLGLLRLDVDDYLGAIPELEIAKKGLPKEPKICAALGTAYSRAGRKQESAQARAEFVRLNEEQKKSAATGQPDTRSIGPDKIPVGDLSPPTQ
jgi:tetratricopeptide (TPR) repeat protein